MFRSAVAAAVVVGGGAFGMAAASADAPTAVAWWNLAKPASALPVPATPADDGVKIGNGPSGPSAFGGLRYTVYSGGDATLTLTGDTPLNIPPGDGVAACVMASSWRAGGNQAWDARPAYSSQCVAGAVDASGAALAFTVPAAFRTASNVLDVAIVPTGTVPFTASFATPNASSLRVAPGPEASPGTSGADSTYTAPSSPTATLPANDYPAVSAPSDALSPAAPAAPAPAASAPAAPAAQEVALGASHRTAPRVPFHDNSRGQRVMAVALLLAMLATVWWVAGQPARTPRLLGGMGGGRVPVRAARERVGGIGRFARPRSSRPRPL
jgi:hypothetical protein